MSAASSILGTVMLLMVAACGKSAEERAGTEGQTKDSTVQIVADKPVVDSQNNEGKMEQEVKIGDPMTCEGAMQMILSRDYRGWRGLPDGCVWPGAEEERPADPQEWWARSLVSGLDSTWTHGEGIPGYAMARFTYLRQDLMLFDGQNPEMPCSGTELVKALGEPAAKLDWDAGTLPLAGMEWVWPERGIALYLGGDTDHVAYVALFASTTLEDYQRGHLRLQEKKVLRPMKGR